MLAIFGKEPKIDKAIYVLTEYFPCLEGDELSGAISAYPFI